MNKILKKIIYITGLVLLIVVFALNLVYTSNMKKNEVVVVNTNTLLLLITTFLISLVILIICKALKLKSNKIKKKYIILGIVIFIYVVTQMIIIRNYSSKPVADQMTTYKLAVAIVNNNVEEFIDNGTTFQGAITNRIYVERCSHQITLAFIWSIIFRILNSTDLLIIEYLNVISNVITVISIFMICKELSKKYSINRYLALTLILTFVSISLLSTFIYGDFTGLAFAMLGTYFIMRYCGERKWKYLIYAIISMTLSYLFRMNSLIFILAIIVYLFLDLISSKEKVKVILTKIVAILCFIVFTLMPATIVKDYYLSKAGLDKNKGFPILGFFYMGMTESDYSAGWYSYKYADYAYHDIENANKKYSDLIKERLNYFKNNPSYAYKFYLTKLCSMWTENAHSSIRNRIKYDENKKVVYDGDNNGLNNLEVFQIMWQKALMFIIFGCSIIVLVQNRKSISNELILLLTIFIGGFLFHVIWEAKSRYIIPYIVALIPIAAVEIDFKIRNRLKERN